MCGPFVLVVFVVESLRPGRSADDVRTWCQSKLLFKCLVEQEIFRDFSPNDLDEGKAPLNIQKQRILHKRWPDSCVF